MNNESTQNIVPIKDATVDVREIIGEVYDALTEKGYNPVSQVVGYIMSGDPTYITSYKNARSLIMKVEIQIDIKCRKLTQDLIYQLRNEDGTKSKQKTTDGSIHPKEALKEAAKILIQHFMLFSDEKITVNMEDTNGAEEFDEDVLHMRQLLKTKLSDQDLSVRALNCLKAADVDTVGDLVKLNRNDLLKFRNFGKKSLTELDELLTSLNLKFGMDVSIYKLDKD